MRTLIVYGSRWGCTDEFAEFIREQLGDEEFVIFTHIDTQDPPTVADYDRIIMGGSIVYGRIGRKLKRFMEEYRALLLQREIGLFLCTLSGEEHSRKLFTKVFPRDLREHAKASCIPGGMVHLEALSPISRRIVTRRFKTLDTRNYEVLKDFARDMKRFKKRTPAS